MFLFLLNTMNWNQSNININIENQLNICKQDTIDLQLQKCFHDAKQNALMRQKKGNRMRMAVDKK